MIKESEMGEKRVHPTQKPVKLFTHAIEKLAPTLRLSLIRLRDRVSLYWGLKFWGLLAMPWNFQSSIAT